MSIIQDHLIYIEKKIEAVLKKKIEAELVQL